MYKNTTLNDVQLAEAYYPILVDLATHNQRLTLTYGELIDEAKKIYPGKVCVQNAIPVSTGRKLAVVRMFTNERNLPDVTSLIINKGDGECGSGFTDHFNPENARSKVYAYDWSGVSAEFNIYVEAVEKLVTPRKSRKRNGAIKIMSEFYRDNKELYSESIKEKRDEIILLLMEGFSAEESFSQVVDT
ncbi:hypothetical protein ACFL3W_00080 [Pseudomonadota bacterium]